MPCSSSKVSTKSTSERMSARMASSFFAAQGPTKTTLQPGKSFLTIRAVNTMGVRVMEILRISPGYSFSIMECQAGQQEVAM